MCATEFFGSTRVAVSGGDCRVELGVMEEGVSGFAYAGWIVAGFVVCERSPFGSGIYDSITKNASC